MLNTFLFSIFSPACYLASVTIYSIVMQTNLSKAIIKQTNKNQAGLTLAKLYMGCSLVCCNHVHAYRNMQVVKTPTQSRLKNNSTNGNVLPYTASKCLIIHVVLYNP